MDYSKFCKIKYLAKVLERQNEFDIYCETTPGIRRAYISLTSSALTSDLPNACYSLNSSMPFWKKKTSKYAPAYDHGGPPPQGGQAKAKFRKPWNEFKEELLDGMSGGFPQIDNGSGPKKTIYENNNLRYDREKPCQSYGHPHDNFQNYSIQANQDADHPYLNRMAQNSNGAHRVKPSTSSNTFSTFGGSTIANINIQQNSGRISSSRVI